MARARWERTQVPRRDQLRGISGHAAKRKIDSESSNAGKSHVPETKIEIVGYQRGHDQDDP